MITSDNPIIGAISIDPFNFINSTSRFIESKYFLATFVNFVATTSGLSKSSTNPFSAAIENLHFPNPKSNNSYTLGSLSISISLPITPTSAAPFSTYIPTSEGFTSMKRKFCSLFSKMSFLLSSFISGHS